MHLRIGRRDKTLFWKKALENRLCPETWQKQKQNQSESERTRTAVVVKKNCDAFEKFKVSIDSVNRKQTYGSRVRKMSSI